MNYQKLLKKFGKKFKKNIIANNKKIQIWDKKATIKNLICCKNLLKEQDKSQVEEDQIKKIKIPILNQKG